MAKLTEKQKRFCEEYLVDLNATQAAIRAGYKKERASEQAHQLLQKTTVSAFIAELREKQSERTGLTADRVIQEIAAIAFTEDVEITGKEKMHALELLGKHLGAFDQKPVQVEIKDDPLSEALKEIAKGLGNGTQ